MDLASHPPVMKYLFLWLYYHRKTLSASHGSGPDPGYNPEDSFFGAVSLAGILIAC